MLMKLSNKVQMFREGHKYVWKSPTLFKCDIFSIFVAFTQYLNFTSDKVTFSFRRIERRWTVQPTWPPCTMDYDHVKSLAKYYKTFFLQSCTRKLQILLTRESTILPFLSFFTLVSSKFAAYISEQFMLMKKMSFYVF